MKSKIILITGSSKGIGKELVKYYLKHNYFVIGCSRSSVVFKSDNYNHYSLDICDEKSVKKMFKEIRARHKRLDVLVNNAGIASMNHSLLTTMDTVHKIYNTNFAGTFLFSREAAKIMQVNKFGRIVNFTTVATALDLEGESIYASSKAAVISLTKIMAKELSSMGITVNAIGPAPIKTDLIKSVPEQKLNKLIDSQAIKRFGSFDDVTNVIDFFLSENSNFITGQTLYLGGV